MNALVYLSILACAFAAPQFRRPSYHHHHDSYLDEFIGDNDEIFDTDRFFKSLQRDMEQLDAMIEDLLKHFPSQKSSGLQGGQYKINISLNGFDEKDITVKAKEGLVMVQAVHKTKDDIERNYLDIRSLPSYVKPGSGSWTYANGLLKIVFDVEKSSSTTEVAEVTSEPTQAPDREEVESQENDNTNLDADVGARGDNEIVNNEIPKGDNAETVEATTYAVDFNNEVEFVPARLNRVEEN